eukprot:TRINITY_DN46754_c0_g1_i1.p1 TRINITY_DN46754_c0_g1~~TRINITY_DN46754_c0_g1_i1.p1  ORF type:complete len:854 (+),score=166.02 TRINITY_DN46754_c0_g1_i1:57-2618(+)
MASPASSGRSPASLIPSVSPQRTVLHYKACAPHEAELAVTITDPSAPAAGSSLQWIHPPRSVPPVVRTDSAPIRAEVGAGQLDPIRLMVLTWNVGNAPPLAEEVEEWLPAEGEDLDLLAVGVQECAYSAPKKSSFRSTRRAKSMRSMRSGRRHTSPSPDVSPTAPFGMGPYALDWSVVLPEVDAEKSTYRMPLQGGVSRLADANVVCDGLLVTEAEPLRWGPMTRKLMKVPSEATSFRWAYPSKRSEEYLSGLSEGARADIEGDPSCAFLLCGGFILLDKDSNCVAAGSLALGSGLNFNGPIRLEDEQKEQILQSLSDGKRLQEVPPGPWRTVGAEKFAWISAGEGIGGASSTINGGFVFVFEEGNQHGLDLVFFPLADRQLFRPSACAASVMSGLKEPRSPLFSSMMSSPPDSDSSTDDGDDCHHWTALIRERLGEGWRVVAETHLMQMRLLVCARYDLAVTNVNTTVCATGIANVVGNKGGLLACMDVRNTSLCFVSCHLAAHAPHLARRNADCQEILRNGRLRNTAADAASQFDHCFWLGDLNYRIQFAGQDGRKEELEQQHGRCTELIAEKGWSELMQHDQLRLSQSRGEAFTGFREGDPTFPPTFKVLRQADYSYVPERVPSYCDRVLWKSMPHCADCVVQESLVAVPDVTSSDHKPVRSVFTVRPSRSPHPSVFLRPHQVELAGAIYVKNLQATDLLAADSDGTSDPYVTFRSVPPGLLSGATPRTKWKPSTLNPKWAPSEVPVLRPGLRPADMPKLADCTLVLDVHDRDAFTADDALGTALVGLAPPASHKAGGSYAVSFRVPVVKGNVQCGTIAGELFVDLSPDAQTRANAARSDTPSRGCCVLS